LTQAKIDLVLPASIKEWGPVDGADLRSCIAELNNAFVEWRYCYEKGKTNQIRIDRMIFVMKVLHEACRSPETS
jgi:hypothetical protein